MWFNKPKVLYYHESEQMNDTRDNAKLGKEVYREENAKGWEGERKMTDHLSRTRECIYKRLFFFYLVCCRKWCVVYSEETAGTGKNRLHAICCTNVTDEWVCLTKKQPSLTVIFPLYFSYFCSVFTTQSGVLVKGIPRIKIFFFYLSFSKMKMQRLYEEFIFYSEFQGI